MRLDGIKVVLVELSKGGCPLQFVEVSDGQKDG